MSFPLDPDSVIEEHECVHLRCYVWLNALEATFPSVNIDFYDWKVRGHFSTKVVSCKLTATIYRG